MFGEHLKSMLRSFVFKLQKFPLSLTMFLYIIFKSIEHFQFRSPKVPTRSNLLPKIKKKL